MTLLSQVAASLAGASPKALGSAAALTAATIAYLDAKFGISTDISSLRDDKLFVRILQQRYAELGEYCTLYKMLERAVDVKGWGDRDALWFENKTWSYRQLKELADRFAAHIHDRGIRTGDFVAVFTTNSPEMVVTVYALSKLGVVAALINTNLRDETFKHCLNVSTAKWIITTPDLVKFAACDLPKTVVNISSFDKTPIEAPSVEYVDENTLRSIPASSVAAISPAKRKPTDLAVLIYTSGTTGNPKACGVRNSLIMTTSNPLPPDVRNPKKYFPLRIYSALPLFHGTAFFAGLSYSVGNGATLCLRRKFSASQFWKDVHDCKATRVLYIGELCRYLLATPPSPYDTDHKCIVAYGNGLRGDVWERFCERFNVPEIREIYRSTEGVARFDNPFGGSFGAGCVGFNGPVRRYFEDDTFIVKYDPETEAPYRDPKTGFCVLAKTGEEGEAIGRVRNRALLTEYLNNSEATEKKLLRDVFEKGDLFQRTGDLLVRDKDGWVRFRDRVGETFRWKGENVSAGEVQSHICKIPNVQDAIVYGVRLANYDGQAGAAGIVLETRTPQTEKEFMANLYSELKRKGIPSYALPRLVRIIDKIATGVTFKQAKGTLIKRSWDPEAKPDSNEEGKTDSLYWLNLNPPKRNATNRKQNQPRYEPLDKESWLQIETGRAKL